MNMLCQSCWKLRGFSRAADAICGYEFSWAKTEKNYNGKHFVFNMEKQTHQCSVKILKTSYFQDTSLYYKYLRCNVLEHSNVFVHGGKYVRKPGEFWESLQCGWTEKRKSNWSLKRLENSIVSRDITESSCQWYMPDDSFENVFILARTNSVKCQKYRLLHKK